MYSPEDQPSIEEKVKSELKALGLDEIGIIDTLPVLMKHFGANNRKMGTITPKSQVLNIATKARSITEVFAPEELTGKAFLKAALKDPDLLFANPKTIRDNVDGVIKLLGDEGLTSTEYVNAALHQPQLFGQLPETINANVRGVYENFKEDGLMLSAYLHRAALKQPSLFSMDPKTITSHMNVALNIYKKGKIQFGDKFYDPEAERPLKPMLDYLLSNPVLLKSSSENLMLREIYAGLAEKNSANSVLRSEGAAVRSFMFKQAELDDPKERVPHMEDPGEHASPEDQRLWTKRTALRALIRAKILPGDIEEGPGR